MSVAGGFRRLQVNHDLSHVIAMASPETLARVAQAVPGVEPMNLARVILADEAASDPSQNVADAIMLGAARPDEDFDAFVLCLSVLVRERLVGGMLSAPLYWVWESFHEQVAMAEPVSRCAIVQGLIEAQRAELDTFDPPSFDETRTFEVADNIIDALEDMLSHSALPRQDAMESRNHDPLGSVKSPGFVPAAAAVIYGALQAPERIDVANALWRRHGRALNGSKASWAQTIRRGVRHLFEANDRFDPWPEASDSRDVVLIPEGAPDDDSLDRRNRAAGV